MKKILALLIFPSLVLLQFACNQSTTNPLSAGADVTAMTGPPTAVLTLIATHNPNGGPPGQKTFTPTDTPTSTPTATPAPYRIAFEGFDSSSNDGIWTMDADGSNPTRLTFAGGEDLSPRFSTDRTKILFNSERFSSWAIVSMNADGTNVTPLTSETIYQDRSAVWSPNGSQIVFSSSRAATGWFQLFTMNSDGSNVQRISFAADTDDQPAWSPDGTKIVFTRGNILVQINPDGSNPVTLDQGQEGGEPVFSPDGSKIAFASYRNGAPNKIFIMNADGTGATQLTTIEGEAPQYSPDGQLIYFYSYTAGDPHIWRMKTDGSQQMELTVPGLIDSNF